MAIFVKRHFKNVMTSQESYKQKKWKDLLKDTFLALDEKMRSEDGMKELTSLQGYEGDSYEGTAGCTATCVLITNDKIYCTNAGDSRTVLCRGKIAKPLSSDHKPEDPVEHKRITESGGFV